jgi:hypothetical protein
MRRIAPAFFLIAALAPRMVAAADDPPADKSSEPPRNKFTVSYYDFSSGKDGIDINLRHTFKSSTAWLAGYRESDGFDQARVGYEYDYHRGWLTFVPSVQAASHGFVGATLYAEAGQGFIGIVGMGRTNLQPYWNLGFDPNDYIQFGAGYVDRDGNRATVYVIHDNRLDTGQTNTHIYFRRYLPKTWRLTAEVVNEHGTGDDGLVVNAWVKSVDVDWSRWFVRVAVDPHVNYTPDHQVRIAAGARF